MAPTISYNPDNDMFYMITTVHCNFIVKAKNSHPPTANNNAIPK